jgi:putative phosphoesterase
MLIGILSDTHNQVKRTAHCVALMAQMKVSAIFHCGDLTQGPMIGVVTNSGIPSYFVYGNNDDSDELAYEIQLKGGIDLRFSGLVTLADRKIGMAHGDRPALLQKLAAEEPDYLFFGHSHLATDFQQGPTHFINPGALHRAPKYTFCTLDLITKELHWHKIDI